MGGISSFFKKPKDITVTQEPMLTDEQKNAFAKINQFINSGELAGYKAGQTYGGRLGVYDPSQMEAAIQGRFAGLLDPNAAVNSGRPAVYKAPSGPRATQGAMPTRQSVNGVGRNTLAEIAQASGANYDPYDRNGSYAGFKQNVLREGKDASDRLKQQTAFGGNLFSTAHVRAQGDLQEGIHGTLSDELARLYDTAANRQYGAASQLAGLESNEAAQVMSEELQKRGMSEQEAALRVQEYMQQQNQGFSQDASRRGMDLNTLAQASNVAGLQRQLQDQRAKEAYSEWLRTNQDKMNVLQTAKELAGMNVPYGVKSYTIPGGPSPFQSLLGTAAQIGGKALGSYAGGFAGVKGSMAALNRTNPGLLGLLKDPAGYARNSNNTYSSMMGRG